MQRSCLNCFNCLVRVDLVPLAKRGGYRKFKDSRPVVEDKLNSRIVHREVKCTQGMWATQDGREFIYTNFAMMMRNVDKPNSRLKFAEKCMRYSP